MNRRDESGAIAVLVALLAVALIGMSTFIADFGLAYANKRQTQTSADAAALAAAGVFAQADVTSLTCAEMLSAGRTAAAAEAAAKVVQNETDTTPAVLAYPTPVCDGDRLVVRTTVTDTSPQFFGGLFGQSGGYQIERQAAAAVEVATTSGASGRPLAVCSEILDDPIVTGDPIRIDAPGAGLSPPPGCPVPTTAGNWWTLDCSGEDSTDHDSAGHGTAAFMAQIRNGCDRPITVVEGQDAATGPADLNTILAAACPPSSAVPFDCLSGDPGQPDSGGTYSAWKDLIDSGTVFSIPVFCAPPTCDHSSISGEGNSAEFPVHRLVAITMCGYQFISPNRRYRATTPSAACAGPAVDSMLDDMMTGPAGSDPYMIAAYDSLLVSGSITPSTCALGDPDCDGGLRQVRLVE
jgi:hypothetical protein